MESGLLWGVVSAENVGDRHMSLRIDFGNSYGGARQEFHDSTALGGLSGGGIFRPVIEDGSARLEVVGFIVEGGSFGIVRAVPASLLKPDGTVSR